MTADGRSRALFWLALAFALFGLALIAFHLHTLPLLADGQRYQEMAVSFAHTGEFHTASMTMDHPQPGEAENGYTHYFAPLWPVVQAPFYLAFGAFGFEVAGVLVCAAAIAACWLLTRNLWGDPAGVAACGFAGYYLDRVIVQRGSEPLAFLLYVVMVYAIVRSIRAGGQRWILLAGAAAGLAYLARASVGMLFLVGGAAGFGWRLYFHRRGALNRHYLGAIGIFGACWCLWALRNLSHFWDGSLAGLPHALASDAVFEGKLRLALQHPLRLLGLVPVKILWAAYLLWPVWLLAHRGLLDQMRNLRDELQSGIFLSWAVPLVMGAIVSSIFTVADSAPPSPAFNVDNLRYFIFCVPGLLWNRTFQAAGPPDGPKDPSPALGPAP